MNVNEVRLHAGWKDMFKKAVIEETDREERRKRTIRRKLLYVPEAPCWKDLNSYSTQHMGT